jgi:quinol monooxygenase YgiN
VIIVAGTVRLDPAKLDVARGPMLKMIAASRVEDGCFGYSYALDVEELGLVRVFEVWRDRAALEAHFQTPHIAEWRAAWPIIGISERRLDSYDVSGTMPL